MNCNTAQKVWGHPDGFMAGLRATCPNVINRLEEIAARLIQGGTNPFFESVQRKSGVLGNRFYVEHADDNDELAHQTHEVVGDAAARLLLEEHISLKFGAPIHIWNLCCSGCGGESSDRLTTQEIVAIQNAAVRTDADGSDIVI